MIKWDLTQRTGCMDAETEGLNMSQSAYYDVCRAGDDTGWKWNSGLHANKSGCFMNTLMYLLHVSELWGVGGNSVCFFFVNFHNVIRPLGRWGGLNTRWCLDCTVCVICVLHCTFVDTEANRWVGVLSHLSKRHLVYNLCVCFHLVLIQIRIFYRLPLLSPFLCLYASLSPSLSLSPPPSLSPPFCRHQLQSCWLTSDPIDLPCGYRFTVNKQMNMNNPITDIWVKMGYCKML